MRQARARRPRVAPGVDVGAPGHAVGAARREPRPSPRRRCCRARWRRRRRAAGRTGSRRRRARARASAARPRTAPARSATRSPRRRRRSPSARPVAMVIGLRRDGLHVKSMPARSRLLGVSGGTVCMRPRLSALKCGSMDNPILVEALRGDARESMHRGAVAVVDADGAVVASLGDIERPVFPRSAVKVLQALPLVESGAADQLGLDDEELAMACASHSGEPAHTRRRRAHAGQGRPRRRARSNAARSGLRTTGPHARSPPPAAKPSALHNNCSGKHAGFLCVACRLHGGADLRRFARRLRPARAPGDARGHRGAAGRPPAATWPRRRAAPTAARSRPSPSRCASWRSPSPASAPARASRRAMRPRRSGCAARSRASRSWSPAAAASTRR